MDANMKSELITWGVDWDDLSARFMNNDDLIAKFMFKFLKDQSFNELTVAMEAGNVTDAFKAVHTLKGVSGNLGFKSMLEPVVNLTEITRAGSMEGAEVQYELIKDKYETLMDILNKYNRDEKEHLLYSLCPDSLHPRSLYSIIWLIFFM